jgi:hypothetical protein
MILSRFRVRAAWMALLPLAVAGQQRDVAPRPVGTGEISGVVWSADATPQPVRRAVVNLAGAEIQARSVITDDAGQFAFSRLPAGAFSITAKKAAYLPTEYGSAKPGRPGSRIALAAGERRAVALTIFKGGVIGGMLRDVAGRPVPGVSVAAIDSRTIREPNAAVSPETAVTDDRGAYRIFGLMPGEYIVVASPMPEGRGAIAARTIADMDAVLAGLALRQGRPPAAGTSVGAPAPTPAPQPNPAAVGYAPIYFPGTPLFPDAARVRVGPGEEQDGTSFVVSHVPVASIDGVVSGAVPNLAAVQLSITPEAPRFNISTGGITSVPPDAQGVFKYGNLAPGRYRIVARARSGPPDPNAAAPSGRMQMAGGMGGGAPPPGVSMPANGDMLFAVADVEIRGQAVAGVSLNLQLGGTIAGKVVFDAATAPLPDDFTSIRVALSLAGGSYSAMEAGTQTGPAISSVPPVTLNVDGTFEIRGVGPSLYTLNCQLPAELSSVWKLRSAIVEGRDLLDTRVEGPAVTLRGVTLTLSDKRTEVSGTLQSASGQPVSDYYVIAFSTDRSNWRIGSRRSLSTRPATDGRFVLTDLPAGEHFLRRDDLEPTSGDRESLEQVVAAAIRVSIEVGRRKSRT